MASLSTPARLYSALGDGARSNRYDVLFTLKDNTAQLDGRTIGMLCKSASFPGRTHETIDFVYKGRSIPIRGQSAYEQEWTCTFYLTENHQLRDEFVNWIESLDEVHNYVSASYASKQRQNSHEGYTREIKIYQQNYNDDGATAEYTLHNAFPKSVSSIDLNGADGTSLIEFQVTFAYSHFTTRALDARSATLVDLAMNALTDGLNAAADAIMGEVESMLTEGLAALGESIGGLFTGTDEEFAKLFNGVADFCYNPGGWMSDIATSVGTSIGEAVGGAMRSAVSGIKDSLK